MLRSGLAKPASYFCSLSTLVFVLAWDTPAAAQDLRSFGRAVGAGAAGVALGIIGSASSGSSRETTAPRRPRNSGRGRSDDDDDNRSSGGSSGSGSSSESRQGSSSQGRREQASRRNTAQTAADVELTRAADGVESDRNVETSIKEFIDDLRKQHARLLGRNKNEIKAATGLNINEVTSGSIRAALEAAYGENSNLGQFERLSGEMWTRERLLVYILRDAKRSMPTYFDGAGARGPSMTDLKEQFKKSATRVHVRALETAEIIGVSHSFDRFIRTIYENSDRSDGSLWTTGADGRYERNVTKLIDKFPRQNFGTGTSQQVSDTNGLEHQFQYRFRARRMLYDCVSAKYVDLIGLPRKAIPATYQTRRLPGASAAGAPRSGGADTGTTTQRPEQQARNAASEPAVTPNPVEAALSEATMSAAWVRLQERMAENCTAGLTEVGRMATRNEIKPQPARFDNFQAMAPNVGGDRTSISPARLPGAPQ